MAGVCEDVSCFLLCFILRVLRFLLGCVNLCGKGFKNPHSKKKAVLLRL